MLGEKMLRTMIALMCDIFCCKNVRTKNCLYGSVF